MSLVFERSFGDVENEDMAMMTLVMMIMTSTMRLVFGVERGTDF